MPMLDVKPGQEVYHCNRNGWLTPTTVEKVSNLHIKLKFSPHKFRKNGGGAIESWCYESVVLVDHKTAATYTKQQQERRAIDLRTEILDLATELRRNRLGTALELRPIRDQLAALAPDDEDEL